MTIPALSTADKSFICSYVIGSNIDHRKALGIINEITTFTSEYIDGYCWIPVNAPQETNSHSWYWDVVEKDTVWVKVGVRVSSDGYLHAWLLSAQKVSELILWNNAYDDTNSPPNDTTTLHWSIEKMYRLVQGSTTGFTASNIKFQKYTGGNQLYLFGNYNNGLSNSVKYTIHPTHVYKSDLAWYPNNETTILSDAVFVADAGYTFECQTEGSVDPGDWWNYNGPMGRYPDAPNPVFYKITTQAGSTNVPMGCTPTSPISKVISLCNRWVSTGTGDNSGRLYSLTKTGAGCIGCPTQESWSNVTVDISPNIAYVWVAAHCSDGSGKDQTECEAAGYVWIPGRYECDPSFTYDTAIAFTYKKFTVITPDQIDYIFANAQFVGLDHATVVIAKFYKLNAVLDIFDEWLGTDTDELRQISYVDTLVPPPGNEGCTLRTFFTKHVGVGLMASAAVTIDTADWIVTWGGSAYHSSWSTPDGLAARTPSTTNTPYTRPITNHDSLNVVSGEPVLGGFCYDMLTSAGFNSRDPGTETKITYSVSNRSDHSSLYVLATSNAFLSRDPGTETKIIIPLSNRADFDHLYSLVTSAGFNSRDPGTETKIIIPLSNRAEFDFLYTLATSSGFDGRTISEETQIDYPFGNDADFCHLYPLIEPLIGVLYHLKTTGSDLLDGRSWANAWATWSHAMQNVPSGRTLLVMHGTYAGESQANPDNSIVIFLVDASENDAPSTVVVTL